MPREVDAAHDFASVAQDLRNVLQLPSVEWIVLHDYGVENEKEGIVDGLQVRSSAALGQARPGHARACTVAG